MMRRTPVLVPLLLLAAALAGPAWSAPPGLDARLERGAIREGESVRLLVSETGTARPQEPDWTPLASDFDVLDVRTGTRIRSANGVTETSHQWRLTLRPRRTGTLLVPALAAGSARSRPLRLEVEAAGAPDPAEQGDADASADVPEAPAPLSVEMEVDDSEPYVHGSVRLSVRLRASDDVLEGDLSEPTAEGALVRRVGDDRRSTREIAGRRYRVVEREYAVAPQRSGPLHIGPVVFEGLVRDEGSAGSAARSRGSLFDAFFGGGGAGDPFADPFFADAIAGAFGAGLASHLGGPTHTLRAASAPVDLRVRPRPDAARGAWWLPARRVELEEDWGSDPPVFRVGEPVHRRVTLRADGVAADQLPPLDLPDPDGLQQYVDPARQDTGIAPDGLRAVEVVDSVLIPTRAGSLELPAVEVSWWDTRADRARTARIPTRSIRVLPGAGAPEVAGSAPPPLPRAESTPPPATGGTWIVPGAAATLVLLLVGGAGLTLRRRRPAGPPPPATWRQAERALARACRRGDAPAAAAACHLLARLETGRGSLAERAERGQQAELAAALRELERVRYAAEACGAERWSGRVLWRAWRAGRRRGRRVRAGATSALPALYPEA